MCPCPPQLIKCLFHLFLTPERVPILNHHLPLNRRQRAKGASESSWPQRPRPNDTNAVPSQRRQHASDTSVFLRLIAPIRKQSQHQNLKGTFQKWSKWSLSTSHKHTHMYGLAFLDSGQPFILIVVGFGPIPQDKKAPTTESRAYILSATMPRICSI